MGQVVVEREAMRTSITFNLTLGHRLRPLEIVTHFEILREWPHVPGIAGATETPALAKSGAQHNDLMLPQMVVDECFSVFGKEVVWIAGEKNREGLNGKI